MVIPSSGVPFSFTCLNILEFMKKYDYSSNLKDDIRTAIKDTYLEDEIIERLSEDRDGFHDELYDDFFVSDSVTGNGSGSYTFNNWNAEENLCHNMDLLIEALSEFGMDLGNWKGAEWADVTIRCYLLGQVLSEVLDDLESELGI